MSEPNPLYPQKLIWYFYSTIGDWCVVEWIGNTFFFHNGAFDMSLFLSFTQDTRMRIYRAMNAYEIKPLDNSWNVFWGNISVLGIWDWEKYYTRTDVVVQDGFRWTLEIIHREKTIETGGDFLSLPPLFNPFLGVFLNLLGNPDGKFLMWEYQQ